jgi:hypothetical protein
VVVVNSGKEEEEKVQGKPVYCLDGIRHEGSVTLIWALMWNVGNLYSDVKEETQAADLRE